MNPVNSLPCCLNPFPNNHAELQQHLLSMHLGNKQAYGEFKITVTRWIEKFLHSSPAPETQQQAIIKPLELLKRSCYALSFQDLQAREELAKCTPDKATDHTPNEQAAPCCQFLQSIINQTRLGITEIHKAVLSKLGVPARDDVVLSASGSALHCMSTEASDKDSIAIYLPEERVFLDCNLGSKKRPREMKPTIITTGGRHTKNDHTDFDFKQYSLPSFVWHCLNGDSEALDILHGNEPLKSSHYFKELCDNRDKFYSKNLPYIGYAVSRIRSNYLTFTADKKYLSATDLDELQVAVKTLRSIQLASPGKQPSLSNCWKDLKITGNIKYDPSTSEPYRLFDRRFSGNEKLKRVLPILEKDLKNHTDPNSTNYKEMSTIMRLISQTTEIFRNGTFKYPLPDSAFIFRIKCGEADYNREILPAFKSFIDTYKKMRDNSTLPDLPDIEFWKTWLMDVNHRHHKTVTTLDKAE